MSAAQAMDEVKHNISEATEHILDNERASRLAMTMTEQGSAAVQQNAQDVAQLAARIEQSSTALQALNRQTEAVQHISESIRSIADQTNLLTLNAAIEAARAGDSGRGFAVVTDEVRNLAQRTAQATQEIASTLSGVRQQTLDTMHGMQRPGAASIAQTKPMPHWRASRVRCKPCSNASDSSARACRSNCSRPEP
ncbi:Methyl-accepting chemotaxis protein McpU (fragment) [Pseudomonas sp. 8Z]